MSSIFGAYAANLKVNKNEVAIKEDLNVFSFKSFFLFRPTSGCGLFFFFERSFFTWSLWIWLFTEMQIHETKEKKKCAIAIQSEKVPVKVN